MQDFRGWVDVVMQATVFRLFKSPLMNVETLRGELAFML